MFVSVLVLVLDHFLVSVRAPSEPPRACFDLLGGTGLRKCPIGSNERDEDGMAATANCL